MSLNQKGIFGFERIKEKIKLDTFDESDIEKLLLLLRPSSKGIVWELASFIAHQEERTKGLFQELLDTNYAILKHSLEKDNKTEQINPFSIHESIYKTLIIGGIKIYPKDKIKNYTGKSNQECIKLLELSYAKKDDYYVLKDYSKLPIVIILLRLSVSIFQADKEVFTQSDLVDQFSQNISALSKSLNLLFDKKEFQTKSDDITICIMCILHSRQFKLYDNSVGTCEMMVSYEEASKKFSLGIWGCIEMKPYVNIMWRIFRFKGDISNYIYNLPVLPKEAKEYKLTCFNATRNKTGKLIIEN